MPRTKLQTFYRPPLRWTAPLLVALALALASAALAAPRVVAVADAHGDLPALQATLRDAGLIDAAGAWVGGDATLVQLGDLLDRGPQARALLDFAMALEAKAAAGGGKAIFLLGNHEVMNVVGDLRYVVPQNYAEFADAGSEKRRDQAWRDVQKWMKARAVARGEAEPETGSAAKEAWMAAHPAGYLEHREAFGPAGRYGRWLRSHAAIVVVQATLFAHGGVSPANAGRTVAEIDGRVREEIALLDRLRQELVTEGVLLPFFDLPEATFALRAEIAAIDATEAAATAAAEAKGRTHTTSAKVSARRTKYERFLDWSNWSIFTSEGPLWFRGYAQWKDEEAAVEVPKLLGAFGVERLVAGHTPQGKGTIVSRLGGSVYLIDTGMNAAYVKGGRGSALELDGGAVSALYQGGTRELLRAAPETPAPCSPAGAGSPGAAAAPPAVSPATTTPAPAPPSPPAGAPAAAAPVAEPAAGHGTNGTNGSANAPVASPAPAPSAPGKRTFLGPDGKDLPFAGDDALLAFLREAKVVEVKDIGQGITKPRRLTLEENGVRARAIFRDISEEKRIANLGGGRREFNFRDSYTFEPAAYRLSLLFGLDRVPPSDLRSFQGKAGSVQLWIEKATTEDKRRAENTTPPQTVRWKRQLQVMLIWDALVGNTDRNQGNILFGPSWEIWYIDHTRAFRQSTDVENLDKMIWCERGFFQKLHSVSDDQIREAVKGLLTGGEVRGVIERRKKIVAHLDGLVATKGETGVLFDGPL